MFNDNDTKYDVLGMNKFILYYNSWKNIPKNIEE
jgi:hypothetical protein